jgi:FKBP-type peptidyl-prolyl cis-trans isomerase FkpA
MKKLYTISFSLFTILLLSFISCSKTPDAVAAVDTLPDIRKYLADNNIKADSTPEKVFYVIERSGNGLFPTTSSKVKVYYKGYRLDGTLFDQSGFNPSEFFLTEVIEGWKYGIPKIDKGGKIRLFIPANLAYGTRGAGSDIPANTPLLFAVELVDFN